MHSTPAVRFRTGTEVKRFLNREPLLTECHYCGRAIANWAWISVHGEFVPQQVFTDWCGCGEHDSEAGEACVLEAHYKLPKGIMQLEWDHKVPVSAGGVDDPINLVSACGGCNAAKCATPYLGFLLHGPRKWGDVEPEIAKTLGPCWGLGFLKLADKIGAAA